MIIPVRCFTCGKTIASQYEEYKKRVDAGEDAKGVLDSLKITRYCCRRMLISQADLIDETMKYES